MQIEESEGSDSNLYGGNLNPNYSKFAWRLGFESLLNGFESEFSKRSEWLLNERDSNPYSTYSNLNSNKGCLDGLIWISIQEIRILGQERSEVENQGFESPTQRFESLMKNKWRDWSIDSNPLHNDSNPLHNDSNP